MGRRIIELYDAILAGGDWELSTRSTLVRRPGYVTFNSNAFGGVPQKYYSFNSAANPNVIYPIVDTTTNVYYATPGSAAPVSLIAKTQSKQSSLFAVGNYLYIGNPEFSKKWDTGTPQGLTNWGIAIGSINNAVGPNTTGNGVNDGLGGGPAWTNPNNVTSAVSYATVTVPKSATSQGINCTQFGFAIPASETISGISITVDLVSDAAGNFRVTLLKNGSPIGNTEQLTNSGTATMTFGGSSDLWGTTWVPNDINQTTWGVKIVALGGFFGAINWNARNVRATIFGTGGPTVSTVAGTLTATQGFQYLLAFGNSNDGNISNPSPASLSIKPVAQGVQINLTASTDPQVNQIRVFRTTDTGTGAVFFELPTSPYPNTTANVVDNATDQTLQVTQAILVGSLAFSPPPPGLQLMEWYAGRMWGAVGNLLYFSAGPDNSPMGNGHSNWPPANVFALPTTIVKLVPLAGGNGMLVVTLDKIHVVQGITNPGFTVNVWMPDIGARQQNAVDSDGSTVYMFTSDQQFLQIAATGTLELSQNVSDITDTYDPTLVYVAQHRSGSQDSRVFLSNGSTTLLPYNLRAQTWEGVQTPVDGGGVGAIGSIEVSPGVYKFLKGGTAASQVVLQRDLATFTDNNVQYTWGATFGNIPVADPTQLANIDAVVLRMTQAGKLPTVSILPNDISGSFFQLTQNPVDEPPEGNAPQGHRAKRYYLDTGTSPAGTGLWRQMIHLQLQFAFATSAAQEEILSWGLFPNQSADERPGQIPAVQGR